MGIVVNRCDWTINQFIGGQYCVSQILGEGAFGKVYKVKDTLGHLYALKLLKLWEIVPELREPLVNRFEMEFRTGLIKSKNLVHSISHGIVEGNPFIVMEYCPNGNLLQYMKVRRVDLINVAKEVLCGLNDLHCNGKVHRDLKPENVLVKEDGTSALTDFGISGDRNHRMTERNILGRPQQLFGTYAYMPPEQVNRLRGNATVLPTTDVFSFGVMMFQLLTGKLPFGELNDHNDLVIYQRNAKEGLWNITSLDKVENSHLWKNVIAGCLVPDYRKRLQSIQEIQALLPNTETFFYPVVCQIKDSKSVRESGKLRIMQGDGYGSTFILKALLYGGRRILTVGRDKENDLCLPNMGESYISRKHCTLEVDRDYSTWFIRDGQWIVEKGRGEWKCSLNGTYVNSTPITKEGRKLCENDILTIGNMTLKLEY